MDHIKKIEKKIEVYGEGRKTLKSADLNVFVRNQFKQLERRNLRIPVQLFQL